MTVYIVAGRRATLHKGVQSEAGLLTDERCNVDDAKGHAVFTDWNLAKSAAKRWCARCFGQVRPV